MMMRRKRLMKRKRIWRRRRRRKMKYLNCLMSHYEKNLSHVQKTLSSCDPSAKLKFKTGL
jgi:hypothetical protein